MQKAVILTALKVEFQAVRAHLADTKQETHPQGTAYMRGKFQASSQVWDVALVEIGMGNSRAAFEAERAIQHFDPDVALFVGVAGGLKDVRIGDVVAATDVYGYEFGKVIKRLNWFTKFLPRPKVGRSTYRMEQRARAVAADGEWQHRILNDNLDPPPKAIVGPIAAGSQVVTSKQSTAYKLLRENYSDAVAVEMEGHGFLEAAHANLNVEALVIRGISDLIADKSRSDAEGGQERASIHAAAFAFAVLADLDLTGAASRHSPLQNVESYYRAFDDPSRIFNHTYPLIGHGSDVERLKEFVSSNSTVFIISGRNGSGKSKVLKESLAVIECMEHGPAVLIVGDPSRLEVKHLPTGNVLLAIDDMHKLTEGHQQALQSLVRQHSNSVQLVATTNASKVGSIRRSLQDRGFSPDETIFHDLGSITPREMVILAESALGQGKKHIARQLTSITGDSPLITTVAARLISENEIDLNRLVDSQQAQSYIFDRYADVITGNVSDEVDQEVTRSILDLVSALGVFNATNVSLVERASEFLNMQHDQLRRALVALADGGALVATHESYRITPDLLSRYVLRRAAVTPTEESTEYAERVFGKFADLSASSILANVVDLLPNVVVGLVQAELEKGNIEIRDPSLEEIFRGAALSPYREVTSVLTQACCEPQLSPVVLDLLWKLRRVDTRTKGNHPEHPVRVLEDLAELDSSKPLWLYDAILDAAHRWAAQPDAYAGDFSPIDLVNNILRHRLTESYVQCDRYVWSEQTVSSERYGDIRRRAIRLVVEQSRSEDSVVQFQALRSLLHSIWPPGDLSPTTVGEAEIKARSRENDLTLDAIRNLIERTKSPVVTIEAERTLRRLIRRALSDAVPRVLIDLLASLPTNMTVRRTRYLVSGWAQYDFFAEIQDHNARRAAEEDEITSVVQDFVETEQNAASVKTKLEAELRSIVAFGIDPNPNYFLQIFARNYPQIAKDVVELVVTDRESVLTPHLHALLWVLAESESRSDRDAYCSFLQRAFDLGETTLVVSVARPIVALHFETEQERELVRNLSTRVDPEVIHLVLQSLRRFPPGAVAEADAIASRIDLEANIQNAEAFCEIYLSRGVETLADDTVRMLFDKLLSISDVPTDGGSTHQLVEAVLQQRPNLVVAFFGQRIDRWLQLPDRRVGEYSPVPDPKLAAYSLVNIDPDMRLEALKGLANSIVVAFRQPSYYWLRKLFGIIAGVFDNQVIAVLDQLVTDEGRYGVQIVSGLVTDAPREFVFRESDFVARMLEAAESFGEDELERIQLSLISTASTQAGMSAAGDAPEPLNTLQERAQTAASNNESGSLLYAFYKELETKGRAIVEWHLQLNGIHIDR